MAFVAVAELHQIPVGGCHALRVGGCPLVLFRPDGDRLYAVENRCPHEGYPLSTGRVADGRLTCEWHNWKFRLDDGVCELGGEDVRTFPLELRDGRVLIDFTAPASATVWARETKSLEKAFDEGDFAHAARATERLLAAGRSPLEILGLVVRWSSARMPWGADHGLAAAAEYARAIEAGHGDVDLLLVDAIHGLVEPNLRRPPVPVAQAAATVDEALLRATIEAEDVAAVEALVLASPTRAVLPWLLHAATDHFLDYGHGLIFTVSAEVLLDHIGWEDAAPVLTALARSITYGTREDRLPYMRSAVRAFAEPFARLPELASTARGQTPLAVDALLAQLLAEDVSSAVTAVTDALEAGSSPAHVALAIGLAAARRMLDFDVSLEASDDVREGWLDVTHTLTYAEAAHAALIRHPSPDLLRGLYHAARFVQHLGPVVGAPIVTACEAPLAEVVRQGRIEEAPAALMHARARGEPVEAILRELAFSARTVLPLFTAHHVKTTTAALRLSAALREAFPARHDHDLPLMAAARFLATPIRERRLHRRVKDARRFVLDGRRPASRLGY